VTDPARMNAYNVMKSVNVTEVTDLARERKRKKETNPK
jgi:hypothetical protein